MRLSAYRVALVMLACTNGVALAANPDNGSTLAQRWCTGCHVVSGDQVKGTDLAPSFASIAERPDYNVDRQVRAARAVRPRAHEELGDRFIGVVIDSSEGNEWGHRKAAHSVLTEDLPGQGGHADPRDALDQVLDMFRTKLFVLTFSQYCVHTSVHVVLR